MVRKSAQRNLLTQSGHCGERVWIVSKWDTFGLSKQQTDHVQGQGSYAREIKGIEKEVSTILGRVNTKMGALCLLTSTCMASEHI